MDEKCEENLSNKAKDISLIKILAKEKKLQKNIVIPSRGLDILLKMCLEKGEYSSKFAILSSVKYSAEKKIKDDYLQLKNNILSERDSFLNKIFEDTRMDQIYEKIILKVFMVLSLLDEKESLNEKSFNSIKFTNEKIIKLILEKEDKIFRDFIEKKSIHIASKLINKQTEVEKKYDIGFGNNLKDLNEFSCKISIILKEKFKKVSENNAIKNSCEFISSKIIDIFMNCFIMSYLEELKSNANKTFIENSVKRGFSKELKDKIEKLINEFKGK